MKVQLFVEVDVGDGYEPKYHHSESRLEEEAVHAVFDRLAGDTTIRVEEVAVLGEEHCEWIYEMGLNVQCPCTHEPVCIYPDGSWEVDGVESKVCGNDLRSLAEYIQSRPAVAGREEV